MKALKIFGWTVLSLVVLVVATITIVCYIIVTPAQLTPIVRQVADKFTKWRISSSLANTR